MLANTRLELFSELCSHALEQRRAKILSEIAVASSIEERFSILVILLYPKNYGRYKSIQRDTNINAIHWNHVVFNRQRLTSVMIQAFGNKWPEHVYWMITGQKDNDVPNSHPSSLIDGYLEVCEKPVMKRFF
ncbi:hypothetical protein ABE501_16450 [Comamonas testosteroni]